MAGEPTSAPIDLGEQNNFNDISTILPHFYFSGQHIIYYKSLISRIISEKVSHPLDSGNIFFLSCSKGDGLKPGLDLIGEVIAAMVCLEFDINL